MPSKNAKNAKKPAETAVAAPEEVTASNYTEADIANMIAEMEKMRAEISEIKNKPAKRAGRARKEKVPVPGEEGLQVSADFIPKMEMLIALGEAGDNVFEAGDGFTVDTDEIIAAGWSRCYTTITNGWTRTKTAGMAARVCGYRTQARKTKDGRMVVKFFRMQPVPAAPEAPEQEAAEAAAE